MKYKFPADFLFGVSNAASQVEDQLDDTWMRHAREGKVRCFAEVPHGNERLRFWSSPQTELDLAQELGVQVFRLSFDWHRLMPDAHTWDAAAARRYREILELTRQRGMKVMATIFHHGVPIWFADTGGWPNPQSIEHFRFYSRKCLEDFGDLVNIWITLNEPVPWSFLSYTSGLFPPGKKGHIFAHLRSLSHMARAHNEFYSFAHEQNTAVTVGIAHNMAYYQGRGFFNQLLADVTDHFAHWYFLQKIRSSLDFFGINYYGAEWMTLQGPAQYDDLEYSEAGRAIHPLGLLELLRRVHHKFPHHPIVITENGVADSVDWVRPAYLLEHLTALHNAIAEGIPVKGYVHWTLSDNFEWADGYGMCFGLVAVDRHKNLARQKRPSFHLYRQLIIDHGFEEETRQQAWAIYRERTGQPRNYWRSTDNVNGLDRPRERDIKSHDWRLPS